MPRPFVNDDMFAFDFVTDAQLSPTGRYVVYTLMRSHHAHACEYTNLMLIDTQTGIHTALTAGDWTDSAPMWTPDGARILFLSNRTGTNQLYTVTRTDATVTQLTNIPQGCAGPLVLSPDNRTLALSASQRVEPLDLQKPHRWTRHIPRSEGIGNVDAFVKHIYTIDLTTHVVTQLTTGKWHHTPCDWSPDGTKLLYLASFNPDSIITSATLHVTDVHGNDQIILDYTWGIIQQARWLDGAQIVIAGIPSQRVYGSKNDIFVINTDSNQLTCRTASLPNHLEARMHDDSTVPWVELPIPLIIDTPTQSVITCYQDSGRIHIVQIALTGPEQITTLVGGNRFCMPFGFVDNQLIFGVATPTDPSQIVVFDRVSQHEQPLTDINRALRAELLWPEILPIHTTGSDGTPVEGWIWLPSTGQAPYPTMLLIHGGPNLSHGYAFYFDALSLTSAGYAVLMINYRGSTGYGDAFSTAIHGDWGNLDYHDLLAGVDAAIAAGLADANRLACGGLSAGGYHTCWLVTHTHRFKAAVAENPVTNWVSFYGTSDIGPTFAVRQFGGTPYQLPETYQRCSPITYAPSCQTPTLLVVGEEDRRCPAEQSEQFYTVLKTIGCPTEMLRLPKCNHVDSIYGPWESRLAHNEAMVAWLNHYV